MTLRLAILGLVAAACATPRPPAESEEAARAKVSDARYDQGFDALGENLWRAVRDGDDAGATRDLADQLKREPGRSQFLMVLDKFTWQYGRIKDWHLVGKAVDADEETRRYEVECVRGVARGTLTFHRGTRRIIKLELLPTNIYVSAPVSGMERYVSWEPATVGPGLGATFASPRERSARKLPVVVLLGDNAWDRDGTNGPIRPLRDLGDGLALRRVMTLRFDRRLYAKRQLVPRAFTIEEDQVEDLVSAIAVARRHPSVDPTRVFVVAQGFGGFAAIVAARRAEGVAGIVLFGLPARPPLELALELARARAGDEDAKSRLDFEARGVTEHTAPRETMVLGVPASYWYDLEKRDFVAELRALDRPVLLLRGEADPFAPAEAQRTWMEKLAGLPVRAESVPLVTQFLVGPMPNGLSRAQTIDGAGPRVPEYLLDLVADFVVRPGVAKRKK